MPDDELTGRIIGRAIEVHRRLGPGLLESAYQKCLAHEMSIADIAFQTETAMPVSYKNIELDCGYRLDLLVENSVIIELKSVTQLLPIHEAQILTYMKLANIRTGLLINFNVRVLKNGIKRFSL